MPSSKGSSSAYKRSYSSNIDAASSLNSSLVFEFGSAFVRVGVAGECKPRHIFILPQQKHEELSSSTTNTPYWSLKPNIPRILPPSRSYKENSSIGSVDYEEFEPWLSHLYTNILFVKARSRRVIIILPIFHSPDFKNKIQNILLHKMGVPKIYFSNVLECIPYTIGSNAGVIVDIGHSEARVACYFDGHVCQDTLQIVPVGFDNFIKGIRTKLKELTSDRVIHKIHSQEDDIESFIVQSYFECYSQESLMYAFLSSLLKCPLDLRKVVVRKVVFVGGGVEGIPHFEKRFVKYIQQNLVNDKSSSPSTNIHKGLPRKFFTLNAAIMTAPLGILFPLKVRPSCATWIGGSIIGSTRIPDNLWINRMNDSDY